MYACVVDQQPDVLLSAHQWQCPAHTSLNSSIGSPSFTPVRLCDWFESWMITSHNHLYSVPHSSWFLLSKYNLVACRNILFTMLVVVYKVLAVWNDNTRNWTKPSQISGTMMAAHCMTLSLKLALNWSELSAAPIAHWYNCASLALNITIMSVLSIALVTFKRLSIYPNWEMKLDQSIKPN